MEPEEYELVFVSSSGELLARSSTLGSAHDVDLQSVIGLCEAVGDPDPEIVFPSMVMGDYVVDVAACFNVFCVSIMKKASLHVDRNSALNALMPLLALSLTARARKCAIQFDQLRMILRAVSISRSWGWVERCTGVLVRVHARLRRSPSSWSVRRSSCR